MALDEAKAVMRSLLDGEHDPQKRAQLVALQLALGFPHALEIEPRDLEDLRDWQRLPTLKAQGWLAAAATIEALWCGVVLLFLMYFGVKSAEVAVAFVGFSSGLLHGVMGLATAWSWERPHRGTARTLSWLWVLSPVFAVLSLVVHEADHAVAIATVACTVPSLLACVAAAQVARVAR